MGSTKGPILKTALLLPSVVIASLGVRRSIIQYSYLSESFLLLQLHFNGPDTIHKLFDDLNVGLNDGNFLLGTVGGLLDLLLRQEHIGGDGSKE